MDEWMGGWIARQRYISYNMPTTRYRNYTTFKLLTSSPNGCRSRVGTVPSRPYRGADLPARSQSSISQSYLTVISNRHTTSPQPAQGCHVSAFRHRRRDTPPFASQSAQLLKRVSSVRTGEGTARFAKRRLLSVSQSRKVKKSGDERR